MENNSPPEGTPEPLTEKQEKERKHLVHQVLSGELDTLQAKVAWVLNQYPQTRGSDRLLQLRFWEAFEGLDGTNSILKSHLFDLTPLTSLDRARRKIQNTYRLFQASPEVRKRRGQLSEEQQQKAVEQQSSVQAFNVYVDESGKTSPKYLLFGSVWILHSPEQLAFLRRFQKWKNDRSFEKEFHFADITPHTLSHYLALADFLGEQSQTLSFKCISVARPGIRNIDEALKTLLCHLIIRGVQHEHGSGRAPLPRGLNVYKDLEQAGSDQLLLVELRDRLTQASMNQFNRQLSVDELEVADSKASPFIQVADLYTGSINRLLNSEGLKESPKDTFARRLLTTLGMLNGPQTKEDAQDMTVYMTL